MENQQEQSICSPLAELPASLPPVPPQDSSSQKTLTLSERMRTKLGDNCMLALDQPELSAESLAAVDQTVSVARSLRQELQAELEQLEDNNSFPVRCSNCHWQRFEYLNTAGIVTNRTAHP